MKNKKDLFSDYIFDLFGLEEKQIIIEEDIIKSDHLSSYDIHFKSLDKLSTSVWDKEKVNTGLVRYSIGPRL